MPNDVSFVPKILLCGDEAKFLSKIGDRPFKIVGHAKIAGEVDGQKFDFVQDNKIFFNGKLQDLPALIKFLQSNGADYFLFTSLYELAAFRNNAYKRGYLSSQVGTLDQLKASPPFFYDAAADFRILPYLKSVEIKTLLDVDSYFAQGRVFTKWDNDLTEIDAISEKPLPPITENIYTRVYKNFADVGLKHYDAALIIERPPIEFDSMIAFLENVADTIITFVRMGSELERHIYDIADSFGDVYGLRGGAVNWHFIKYRKPPEDFCTYVVTYKNIKLAEPPEGYKIIQAGRAPNGDFGYPGDDTGDNISRLNLYLNEITALYWFWKNTTHTTIGLCHYRRFFTESEDISYSYDKILTREAALKILERYDIIVSELYFGSLTQREWIVNDCGEQLTSLAEAILRKHILQAQPDYLESFEYVLNSSTLYKCNLFITRRNVLDAYCKWLFSFIIDATEEILRRIDLASFPFSPRRLIAFFVERMLTVWLRKNRLRIKELKIMFIEGL
ncbi:MAG: DUF4422 domain-containing protein [Selenomonadaceae bacterium]|nr:DUF4422 domain-containing protein [Selenomonadaceae bacterium]